MSRRVERETDTSSALSVLSDRTSNRRSTVWSAYDALCALKTFSVRMGSHISVFRRRMTWYRPLSSVVGWGGTNHCLPLSDWKSKFCFTGPSIYDALCTFKTFLSEWEVSPMPSFDGWRVKSVSSVVGWDVKPVLYRVRCIRC